MQQDAFITEGAGSFPFEIRYEGGDAEVHRIDMAALAESLDGFSRIYAVVAHFATTGQYAKQTQALNAKAYAQETQAKCFSVAGAVEWATTNGVFQGLGGVILTLVLNHVYQSCSGAKEEMKHLRELFEKQLGFNQQYVERLLNTIEKLTDAMQPSARKSVAPIGDTCDRIDLYSLAGKQTTIGLAEKEAIMSSEPAQILPAKKYSVIISEMDRLKRTCKASFTEHDTEELVEEDGSPKRISCDITDPVASLEDNPYLQGFISGKPISIVAKAMLRNGVIAKLYISDVG